MDARIATNRRRGLAVALGFGAGIFAFFGLILGLLAGWLGLAVALVIAVAWVAIAWVRADAVVLDLSDVEPADEERHARLFNVTAGMCAAAGVSPPDLYVVDDPALNALAAGTNPRNASLVVTQGLLDELSLVELEAVVALQLYRVKSAEIVPETIVVTTVGAAGVLSEMFEQHETLSRILGLPMPLIERVLAWLHPGITDLDVDIATVELTRYPPGLAAALEKMSGRSALGVGAAVTAHLWAAPPIAAHARPVVAKLHAPLTERIAVLQEL